jgi:hypothetical protein
VIHDVAVDGLWSIRLHTGPGWMSGRLEVGDEWCNALYWYDSTQFLLLQDQMTGHRSRNIVNSRVTLRYDFFGKRDCQFEKCSEIGIGE